MGDASSLSAVLEHERCRRHRHPVTPQGVTKTQEGFPWVQEAKKAPNAFRRPRRQVAPKQGGRRRPPKTLQFFVYNFEHCRSLYFGS